MRVREIARLVQGAIEGQGDLEISGAAPLESAGPSELAFVGNRKAAASAASSRAGCLIVPADFPAGRTLVRVTDPRSAFARFLLYLYPQPSATPGVHPTAVIADGVELPDDVEIGAHVSIGRGTRIGPGSCIGSGCAIGAGVSMGEGCMLHANVTLYDGVKIGDHAVLHSGCVLGADGFGFVLNGDHYEKFPQVGRVEIGDYVEIGANSCVDRAALGVTQIGSGTKLDNMVHVGHNCRIGKHVVIAAQTGLSGGVVIEDYAVIGGQVGIGDKARIETKAVLGSGSGILTSKIVRHGQVVWGTPARPLKQYLQQLANLTRLPELRKELAELKRRLNEIERT